MLYIANNGLDMYYLIDQHGNVARSIMCARIEDLLAYCEKEGIQVQGVIE